MLVVLKFISQELPAVYSLCSEIVVIRTKILVHFLTRIVILTTAIS
jgi:hypothetical protein